MKNNLLKYLLSIPFVRLFIISLISFLFLVSCSVSSGNNKSSNNKLSNSQKNSHSYILIGAKGRFGKGSVFKCTLDGYECTEFLGGNMRFQAPSKSGMKPIKLFNGDLFGSSVLVVKDKMFIGAIGRDNKKGDDAGSISSANYKDEVGTVFQCNLNGTECQEFLGGHNSFQTKFENTRINLMSADHFGSTLFHSNNKIYIGSIGRDNNNKDDVGSIFQCDLDGKNCNELIGGKNKSKLLNQLLNEHDSIGSSLFMNNNSTYVGAMNKNAGNGGLLKCNNDISKCNYTDVKNIHLSLNDAFSSSLVGNEKNIFVGAIGRNEFPTTDPNLYDIGAVFKCDLEGTNCSEIIAGENKSSAASLGLSLKDNLGSSLAILGNYLYIGASGRINNANARTGAVFRCQLDGSNCIEFIGGRSKGDVNSDSLDLLDGDLFGSSLAIVSVP